MASPLGSDGPAGGAPAEAGLPWPAVVPDALASSGAWAAATEAWAPPDEELTAGLSLIHISEPTRLALI
eukprot:7014841-Alexandrium_andersonii.AAC.1